MTYLLNSTPLAHGQVTCAYRIDGIMLDTIMIVESGSLRRLEYEGRQLLSHTAYENLAAASDEISEDDFHILLAEYIDKHEKALDALLPKPNIKQLF